MGTSQQRENRDSTIKEKKNPTAEKRDAPRMPLLFKCLLFIMLTLSLVFFATKLVEYNRLRQETEKINEAIQKHENNAAELRFLIESPVDDAYIIRIARERIGLVFPDEEIFYDDVPQND